MLYATTRRKSNIETAYKSIHLDCAADGGLFIPFRRTKFSTEEILTLKDRSFAQNMAEILNHFFGCGLTAMDVEFAIGKVPVNAPLLLYNGSAAYSLEEGRFSFCHAIDLDMWETVRKCEALFPDLPKCITDKQIGGVFAKLKL